MNTDLIGRIIKGRYKLIDERGSGSFGAVYIARDLLTNYIYAAKVMHLEQVQDGELLERFKREAYILQNLDNPHIVHLVDYGSDHSIYFIMMHHVDGQTFKWHMEQYGQMELIRAINYTKQAAEGLDAAYKQGIVHRDIKPQNILISNKGMVKIADFGLSRGMDSPTLTNSRQFMGTAYYTAPEQVQHGHSADTRSDLYSLAVVFYESLAGQPPYSGGGVIDIIFKHLNAPIPSIWQVRPDAPLELDAFFQRALAKSPQARYQTPREFIRALDEIQLMMRGSGPVTAPPQARLVFVATGQTFTLKGESMMVGRGDPKQEIHPEIQIDDPKMTVGRQHARLLFQQGKWMLEDLNSRNKTRLNGNVLVPSEPLPLQHGDILHFGRIEARFEIGF